MNLHQNDSRNFLSSTVHTKVIQRVIGDIAQRKILRKNYHSSTYFGPEYTDFSVEKVLVRLGYGSLVSSIIESEEVDKDNPRERYISNEMLQAYIGAKKFEEVFELIKKYPPESDSQVISSLREAIFEGPLNPKLIDSFLKTIISQPKLFSYDYRDPAYHIRRTIESLIESKQYTLAKSVNRTYMNDAERPMFACLIALNEKKGVSDTLLVQSCKRIMSVVSKEHYYNFEKILSDYIKIFGDAGMNIDQLRLAIQTIESLGKTEYRALSDTYEIKDRIRSSLFRENRLDEAEEFMKTTGDIRYYGGSLIEARLNLAIKNKDKKSHEEQLKKYIAYKNRKEDTSSTKKDDDSESEYEKRRKKDKVWQSRIDEYQKQADLLCEEAIFEIIHGDNKKAEELIDTMAEYVKKIGIPGEGKITKRNQGHLHRVRKRVKREIKIRFFALGLKKHLPKYDGWQDAITQKDYDTWQKEREKRSQERQKQRDEAIKWSNAEYKVSCILQANEEFKDIKRVYRKGGAKAAVTYFGKKRGDFFDYHKWYVGEKLIQLIPESYGDILKILTYNVFKRDYGRSKIEKIPDFIMIGLRIGQMTKTEWKYIIEGCRTYIYTDDGQRNIPEDFVVETIKKCLDEGFFEDAWNFFEGVISINPYSEQRPYDANFLEICYGMFLQFSEKSSNRGLKNALIGKKIDADATDEEKVDYWNLEAEKALLQGNVEKYTSACEELLKILTANSPKWTILIKRWIEILSNGGIRTHHQKKDILMAIYGTRGLQLRIKYRIIKALIEHKIPGTEGVVEIKSKKTNSRITQYFFRKLADTQFFHKEALQYVDDGENLPYLRQLLSEFQNQFNTVMESLDSYFDRNGYHRTEERAPFSIEDWKGILLILKKMKAFSPGIFAEARKANYDEQVIDTIKDKIEELKKALFLNKKVEQEVSVELEAEVIYFAYKPANMTLGQVTELCRRLKDCSAQLSSFVFPQEGYILDLGAKKEMNLRKGSAPLETPDHVRNINGRKIGVSDKKIIQEHIRNLCEIGRLKITQEMGLTDIMAIFETDSFMRQLPMHLVQFHSNPTKQYESLRQWQEGMGIYLEDNLEKMLQEYLKSHCDYTSAMVTSLAQSIRGDKLRKVLETQLGIKIEDTIDDIPLVAFVISQVILQKFKPLQKIRKSIKEDIKKYVTVDGGEVGNTNMKLRAVISKSKASFFAKASAGICTANDIGLFQREDHFHINIVDDQSQTCVGNIQAYIMQNNGKKYLLLRGFNPSTNLLKEIDAESFTESILAIGKKFTDENNLDGMLLSEQGGFLALSNRGEVKDYIHRRYQKTFRNISSFQITSSYTINNAYWVYDKSVPQAKAA